MKLPDIAFLRSGVNRLRRLQKRELFIVLLLITGAVAGIVSLIAHVAVLNRLTGPAMKVAIIAPLSGPDRGLGEALRDGAALWAQQLNRGDGLGGRPVQIVGVDETDPQAVAHVAADPNVIAVLGPTGQAAADAAASAFQQAGLVGLTLSGVSAAGAGDRPALLPIGPDSLYEAKFLANYVRNVVGERLVSIILPDNAENAALAAAFDEVMQRFGTRVVYRWVIDPAGGRDAALAAAASDIFDRKIAGTLLVLGGPDFAAHAVAALRAAKVPNRVIGTRAFATDAFQSAMQQAWHGTSSVGAVLNNTLVATPMLFDTAGIAAQAFHADFAAATGRRADWAAALAYDAGRLIQEALKPTGDLAHTPVETARAALRARLAAMRNPANSFGGLAGLIFFAGPGGSSLPVLIGNYDGQELVSALTQLSPIREEGISNYLQELTAGRALYVTDRFMYKTNVVYSGTRLEQVFDINTDANIADLQFIVWFRWNGAFDPQDVVFPNAVQPIQLSKPEREGKSGDLNYRAYRVHAKFYMNVADVERPYGTQLLQITFHHRTLSRLNLMYVGDVLGMGLGRGDTAATNNEQQGWLERLLGVHSTRDPLAEQLDDAHVLAGVSGWVISRALLSQELIPGGTDGDPVYVGFGRPAALFSNLVLGVIVKPDALDVRDVVPGNWFVYIAIFAFCGAILAHFLDIRDRGQFWRIQTLFLRLITWPALLLSASNLALDYALANASASVVSMISQTSHALWWIVPAQLAVISIERFVWVPLENRTGRKIPTVFRIMVSMLVYSAAALGVLAFVLEKTITSLLASTGLLAMIIGLAIQSNLKDVFSGIMLNLERPFSIGDWVKINGNVVGRVHDVTWRTTRLETGDGILALPNGKMSEANIENLSRGSGFEAELVLQLDPKYTPERVIAVVERLVASIDTPPYAGPYVRFRGVENVGGCWVARYVVGATVTDYKLIVRFRNAVWQRIWAELREAGIEWDASRNDEFPMMLTPRIEAPAL